MRLILLILCCYCSIRPAFAQNTGVTGKWRWQVKGTDKDLQQDYLLELDLKQDGSKVVGTRTLYLKEFDNIVIWMEGEINSKGVLNMTSRDVVQFHLPDSILAAKRFTFQFNWNKSDKDQMSGLYTPFEDADKQAMRKLDPYFYDVIYKMPVRSSFTRLADTVSKAFHEIIVQQKAAEPPALPVISIPKQSPVLPQVIETEIEHTLRIPNADVTIELYDNGTIDGDIVTVLVNDKVVSSHQKLGLAPIRINLKKEELGDSTMIIMQAENLGDIPPNTALMLITVAGKRYDLNVSSTLQKRAAVILYKKD